MLAVGMIIDKLQAILNAVAAERPSASDLQDVVDALGRIESVLDDIKERLPESRVTTSTRHRTSSVCEPDGKIR